MAKLRHELYFLCLSPSAPGVIRGYEDRAPYRLQVEIDMKEIKSPFDIGSHENGNCLYTYVTSVRNVSSRLREKGTFNTTS